MEIQLILGTNSSGKSKFAESLAVAAGKLRIYLATMVPQNEENHQRIEKHRIQRKGKGFRTVEEPWEVASAVRAAILEAEGAAAETVVLLEDASNFLANGMFMHGADAKAALKKILDLADSCKTLIVVSISGLQDEGYDAETVRYIEQLNWLNEKLKEAAVQTIEMQKGKSLVKCSGNTAGKYIDVN